MSPRSSRPLPRLVRSLRLPLALCAAVSILHAQDFRRQQRQEPLPPAMTTVTEENGLRIIRSNGVPNHTTGDFPNRGNPNSISAQSYEFRMPLKPRAAPQPTPSQHASFGVAVNGIPFEPGTAEFWRNDPAWKYEALSGKIDLGIDQNIAHVQPSGAYHYHGLPTGLVDVLGGDDGKQMRLLGWAADGFPIYTAYAHQEAKDAASPLIQMRPSYQLKKGNRPANAPGGPYDGSFTADFEFVPGSGDLDECNGRVGVTPEYPQGTFYYCVTHDFPNLSRLWKGTPDSSFQKGPPGGGGPGGPGGSGPRRGRRGGPGGPGGPPPMGPPPGFGPGPDVPPFGPPGR